MKFIQRTIKGLVATSVSFGYFVDAMNMNEVKIAFKLAQTNLRAECPNTCNLPFYYTDDCSCACPSTKPEGVDCGQWGRWDSEVCDCVCDEQSETDANCQGCGCFNFETSICACNTQVGKPEMADCGKYGVWSDTTCDCVCDDSSKNNANCQAPSAFNRVSSVCDCECLAHDKASAGCLTNQEFDAEICQCTCDAGSVTCPSSNQRVDTDSCECTCPPEAEIAANCAGSNLSWNQSTCECECPLTEAECQVNNPFTILDGCSCQCNPMVILAVSSGETVCSQALPSFNPEACQCECEIDQTYCSSLTATPDFAPEICQCICAKTPGSCKENERLKIETCECVPDTSADCGDINSINYDPSKCSEPVNLNLTLVGCDWFMKSVTDTSYPDIDFEKNSSVFAPKVKDSDECHDENGELRRLGKFNAPGLYGPEFYPSGEFRFYSTFWQILGLNVYNIQSGERSDKCPEYSWLSFDQSKCLTESYFDIAQVGVANRGLWLIEVREAVDDEGICNYFTISPWAQEFPGSPCVDNAFRIDLFDKSSPNSVGLSNFANEDGTPTGTQRFFFEGFLGQTRTCNYF